MNEAYRYLFEGQAAKAVTIAKSAQAVKHNGLKGELRETVVHDLLRPFLPNSLGIGSGQIISAYNQTSRQMDVVVFDNSIVPPILSQRQSGLIPVEAALLSVEVKSKLTRDDLINSHNAALDLGKLLFAPPMEATGYPLGHDLRGVIPYLLAFDTNLGRNNETQCYDEILQGASPAVYGICIVGRGFWFWNETRWERPDCPWEFGEIAAFIMAIISTWQRTASTRRRPDMRDYLLWHHEGESTFP